MCSHIHILHHISHEVNSLAAPDQRQIDLSTGIDVDAGRRGVTILVCGCQRDHMPPRREGHQRLAARAQDAIAIGAPAQRRPFQRAIFELEGIPQCCVYDRSRIVKFPIGRPSDDTGNCSPVFQLYIPTRKR